ncbi:unnamed protein product [Soboliphyme baturini]|uniref:Protein TSSC4 n=1 Tax=Soboliphyme baturini TaxID=241478 RepID=A0A183IVI9_9BILA|nr:unnamed protein product [Soboliphyme baturini]
MSMIAVKENFVADYEKKYPLVNDLQRLKRPDSVGRYAQKIVPYRRVICISIFFYKDDEQHYVATEGRSSHEGQISYVSKSANDHLEPLSQGMKEKIKQLFAERDEEERRIHPHYVDLMYNDDYDGDETYACDYPIPSLCTDLTSIEISSDGEDPNLYEGYEPSTCSDRDENTKPLASETGAVTEKMKDFSVYEVDNQVQDSEDTEAVSPDGQMNAPKQNIQFSNKKYKEKLAFDNPVRKAKVADDADKRKMPSTSKEGEIKPQNSKKEFKKKVAVENPVEETKSIASSKNKDAKSSIGEGKESQPQSSDRKYKEKHKGRIANHDRKKLATRKQAMGFGYS